MNSLTSPRVLKALLEKHGFRFTKSLGQNFIIDENVLKKIVNYADITKSDFVLEIGPGAGTMTRELAERARFVAAVEIDKRLIPVLDETIGNYDNVKIINADILKLDVKELIPSDFAAENIKIVANLPYYITTPIIMKILEEGCPFNKMVMLVQKEVAERIEASPGTKDYGALSVAVRYYARPVLVGKVSPGVFMPPPKVDSMILGLEKRETPPVEIMNKELFFKIVKAVFNQRRKTLLNALHSSGIVATEKDTLSEMLSGIGIDANRRGETLSMDEFGSLTNVMESLL